MTPFEAWQAGLLYEDERPCQICGAGTRAHSDGRRRHPMPPPEWMDIGSEPRDREVWFFMNIRDVWRALFGRPRYRPGMAWPPMPQALPDPPHRPAPPMPTDPARDPGRSIKSCVVLLALMSGAACEAPQPSAAKTMAVYLVGARPVCGHGMRIVESCSTVYRDSTSYPYIEVVASSCGANSVPIIKTNDACPLAVEAPR